MTSTESEQLSLWSSLLHPATKHAFTLISTLSVITLGPLLMIGKWKWLFLLLLWWDTGLTAQRYFHLREITLALLVKIRGENKKNWQPYHCYEWIHHPPKQVKIILHWGFQQEMWAVRDYLMVTKFLWNN